MEVLRAVFDAPRDCSQEQLERDFKRHGRKFLEHFESEGWVLRSPLNFYADFGASKDDPNKIHYVIVGWFTPNNRKEQKPEEVVLPKKVVDKLKQKFGGRIKVNE